MKNMKSCVHLAGMIILICALLSSAAFAEPLFGGTKAWPEFRGMQFGIPAVALVEHEEDAGTALLFAGNGGEAIDWAKISEADAYPLITGEALSLLDADAKIYYLLQNGDFASATVLWPAADEGEALALFDALCAQIEACYGEADLLELLTSDGETIPADPQEDYYTLFGQQQADYGAATPVRTWLLGRTFRWTEGGSKTTEGRLTACIRTVAEGTLEEALGGMPGNPAVEMQITKGYTPAATNSNAG